VLAGVFAVQSVRELGSIALENMEDMGESLLGPTEAMGDSITAQSVESLDTKSTENIETRTIDLANRIAGFLYGIDGVVESLAVVPREGTQYVTFYKSHNGQVVVPSEWVWDSAAGQWRPKVPWPEQQYRHCKLDANKKAWHYNEPLPYRTEWRPLFKELTVYDLDGRELLKVNDEGVSDDLRDISNVSNTFCRAETYFQNAQSLKEGELYVSPVVATYEPFWGGKPGVFNPEQHPDRDPRKLAYAGRENPLGTRSEGLIRWVLPIYENGEKVCYVTAALDHRHVQELVEHIHPTPERFTELHDPGSGNYAFIWDNNHRAVAHPRHYFQCGYDKETGEAVPGWTSSRKLEQLKAGRVPLDGRVLDFAPQCQGWKNITEEGGNGSFQILWSGLYKLTTVATIPYRTGANYSSPRGFGYVTIGANVDDFHKDALVTKQQIAENIAHQRDLIGESVASNKELMTRISQKDSRLLTVLVSISLVVVCMVAVLLSLGITKPLKQLSKAATDMAGGDLEQHVKVNSRDEVKDLADAFNKMASHLGEVDRMKSEFVTVASHELRTPIHAMLLGVSAILDGYCGDVSEEVNEDLQVVNEGITRLTRLIENLLNLSRIESGKAEMESKPVSMVQVLDSATEEVSDLAKQHGHTIVKEVNDAGEVVGDRDRLSQAVVNLVGNAIKYTPDGGKIIVTLDGTENEVRLSVADNGYGIPEEAHEKVFEKFFQADSLLSKEVGGTGLGLAITRGLVQAHGGRINLMSPLPRGYRDLELDGKDRKGTVFTMTLPRIRTAKPDTTPVQQEVECLA
jgi:signal transduction histidine kinase